MTGQKGFTLIEVLVASTLVAIVLLASGLMTTTAFGTLDRSGDHTTAVTLSHQRIEWLRNQGYTSVALSAGTSTETLTGTYAGYTRLTTIVDNIPRNRVKQITVRTTAPGGLQSTVVSYVAQ